MPEMDYIAEDWDFPFLIKTMKKKYLERTLKEGRFCFNTPSAFIEGEGLASAQQDKYEAHLSFEARHIMVAPILYENENGPCYGNAERFVDRARAHFTTEDAKHTPLCSFRFVAQSELVKKYGAYFFRLGDVVIVVAVGTGKVEAYHLALCLTNFRYIGKAYDKSAQPQIKTCITHNGRKGNIGCHGRTFKNELLAILREGNGAELTHAFAAGKEDWCLLNVLDIQSCSQVAVLVVHLAVVASSK